LFPIEEHFSDPNKEETVQRKLHGIKQGGQQAEDFVTDFQTIKHKLDLMRRLSSPFSNTV